MPNYEIVDFEEKYVEDLYNIVKISLKDSWSLSSLRNELNNNLAKYILLKSSDNIIGFASFWIIADEAQIMNVAVHPEFRGIGFGNVLIEEMIKICTESNIYNITLEVRKSNITAQNLYKKFGFVEEGVRKGYYQDNNEDGIIMWKREKKIEN